METTLALFDGVDLEQLKRTNLDAALANVGTSGCLANQLALRFYEQELLPQEIDQNASFEMAQELFERGVFTSGN